MGRHEHRDMTVEEYHHWAEAHKHFKDVRAAGDEEGGPALSLVPL